MNRLQRTLTILAALSLAGLAADTVAAVLYRRLPWDLPVAIDIQRIQWGPALPLVQAIDWLTGLRQAVFALLLVAAVVAMRRWALPLLVAGLLSGTGYGILNRIIARPRPDPHLVHVLSHPGVFSYPSGHVVFFEVTSVLVALVLTPARSLVRHLAVALAAALTVLVMVSRVWDGDHWPSDVLGGLALGTAWICGLLLIPRLSRRVFDSVPVDRPDGGTEQSQGDIVG